MTGHKEIPEWNPGSYFRNNQFWINENGLFQFLYQKLLFKKEPLKDSIQ
jgi:hypothetical protein